MAFHVVSIGDLVLDIVLPVTLPVRPAGHQDVPLRRVEPGGAANFMIAARHLGLNVSAGGTVGADAFGVQILEPLRAEGVDTAHVVTTPGSTSTLVVVLTDQQTGEHTFIGHYGEGPEVPYPAGLDRRIAQANAVFIQGYTLAEKRVVPMALRAIEQAAANRVPVYLDVGPLMAQVSPDQIDWVVARTSLILMTKDEVPLISGGLHGQRAYTRLLDRGVDTLVIKQGPAGCAVVTCNWLDDVPGFRVPVVDTVGAGDCFDAAFVAGLLNGLTLWECGRLANAMGAVAVQKVGAGRNAPTCAEVMALLNQAGDRIQFKC
jgi:sugar/nucleoside kinase (ribokinase family)